MSGEAQRAAPPAGRNYTFDGLRGVAAILVMLFHLCSLGKVNAFHGGYLAVDFFFILSGYVVEGAYGPRLRGGMTIGRFTEMRLVRLYPLYLLGLLLGLGRALKAINGRAPLAPSGRTLAIETAANALLLPSPLPGGGTFPLNTPSWSLSLEVAVNILFAAYLVTARRAVVAMVCAVGAAAIVYGALLHGHLDLGWPWNSYLVGVGRTLFGFCIGVLLARRPPKTQHRHSTIAGFVQIAMLAVILSIDPGTAWRGVFDLVAVLAVFPAMVWMAARTAVTGAAARLGGFLGDLSYPLYAIHYPIGIMALNLLQAKRATMGIAVPLTVVICLVAAFMAAKLDEIVRVRLSAWFHVRRSARLQVN